MKPVLLGLVLVLGTLLAIQWQSWAPNAALPPPPVPQPAAAGDGGQGADPLDPFALEPPPKSEYASVVERPLFLPERRPPPDEPEEEPVAEEPMTELDGVDLTAVVITPAVVSAWVSGPQSKEVKRLRLGDDYLGWTVKTIEPARLVLERQGETDELPLRDYTNAPARIPPTRLPPRRAGGDQAQQPDPASDRADERGAAEPAEPPEQRRRAIRRPVQQTRGRGSNAEPARQPPNRAPTP
jgi:hypothetical protein